MGWISAIKKIFSADDAELREARARHTGSEVDPEAEYFYEEQQKHLSENYDAWEEIDGFRTNFFFGRFLGRKISMPRSEKLRQELEALEKKKAEEKQRNGEG
jgi:hypothetical protein